MSAHPGTTQRFLDWCLQLPVGASRTQLEGALTAYNPGMGKKARAARLSQMAAYTDPRVRENIATIAAWAGRMAKPGGRRYSDVFYRAAVAIKRGETLR